MSEISEHIVLRIAEPDIFAVLANPVRRRILVLLMDRPYLEHAGSDLDSSLVKRALEGMSGGWPAVLERIAPAIDAHVVA